MGNSVHDANINGRCRWELTAYCYIPA